ncbi:MAG TPA: vitamin B12 dependent-methionine synthase activation domain-containing protein [Acetivibrio sp.]|uniref:methionine synthase n=1 Tax=Acetivibrio sp. TaxID=1872092 RepID=UPI002CB53EE4|nr:methionine synthase [Acetivibrio sp.]HOM03435.1 vitamin B12 dependent-methionine synthase activation domain-containing protein [Acetivibrio sp.]
MEKHTGLKFFEHIPAVPDNGMILTRLGYRKTTTILDDNYKKKLAENINKGLMLCNTKGVFGTFKITKRDEEFVELENGVILKSKSLSKLLSGSMDVVLMAATVGKEIVDRIVDEINKDGAFAVILDAVASETADAALDWMVDFINRMIRREGKKLTKMRYSPGYGDLPLSNQKLIFDTLNLERLGISITERFMLVPEKSVIAIAGVEGVGWNE